jgi:GNAT superfamily N-acetyltransferase
MKPSAFLEIHRATPQRWGDVERLFGAAGGAPWRRFAPAARGELENARARRSLRDAVESGAVLGLIAYAGADPVGWCSLGFDGGAPAFYVRRGRAGRGVRRALLRAALEACAEGVGGAARSPRPLLALSSTGTERPAF